MNKGYIKRYRSIYDWYQKSDLDVYALAIYDYLNTFAAITPKTYKGIALKEGQVIRSYQKIADDLKLSRRTVIRRIKLLSECEAVSYNKLDNNINIFTVNDICDTKSEEDIQEVDNINIDELLSKLD